MAKKRKARAKRFPGVKDDGLRAALVACSPGPGFDRGALTRLADRVGRTRSAVGQWKKIPAELVPLVEAKTGVDRAKLRPDLYRLSESGAVRK